MFLGKHHTRTVLMMLLLMTPMVLLPITRSMNDNLGARVDDTTGVTYVAGEYY
jgi:hypothetical protein